MTSNRFLVKSANLDLPYARLDGEEHHHLSRVLRARPGDRVWLVEERGSSFRAEVIEVGRERTRLRILEREEPGTAGIRLALGQALIRSKNMDLVVQKATELGVQEIVPVEASRSVLKLEGREGHKVQRWRKVAREAAKQSQRADVPLILPPQPFSDFLESRKEPRRLILCERQGSPLRALLFSPPVDPPSREIPGIILLVGPEGGWSEDEQHQAIGKGYEAVSLGARILRSETAALAALAAIQFFWGE